MKDENNISKTFDTEEKELLDSFENNEWKRIKNFEQEKHIAQAVATNYLKKDIRISSSDLSRIKQKAAYEGLPYQTLISSILHKYSAGHS